MPMEGRKEGRKEGKPKACSTLHSMAKSHSHLHNDPIAFHSLKYGFRHSPVPAPDPFPAFPADRIAFFTHALACCASQPGKGIVSHSLPYSSRPFHIQLLLQFMPRITFPTLQTALLTKWCHFMQFVSIYRIQLEVSSTLKLQCSNRGKLVISA